GRGPHPLVIMVHGDGPGLRSYFAPLKETMLRAGFATLMWDKPGHGQSTGTLDQKKMMAERAAILLDAVTAMKRRPDIDPARIGLWGISQAGYVMPLALQKGADVNFMIAVGCPGENGIEQTAYLIRRQLMSAGMPEDEARRMEGHFRGIYMAQTFREYLVHARSLYDNPLQRKLGFVSALWTENDWKPHTQDEEAFIDPTGILETTTIPILAFFGENDTQVDPVQGAEAYRRSLVKAGNNHFRVEIIPGVDHNLIPSETGSMEEQARRSRAEWQRYAPAYLNIMEQWLKELSGERRLMTTNLKYRDILGCWEGQPEGRFSALNRGLWLISLRPDGRPAISLINDLTPRCQTREYDIEVRLDEDGSVSWEAHRGRLSEDRKAMTVVKDWKGERTTWTFTRREESDEEMARLAASIGNAYAYEIPESLPDGWECGDLEKAGIDPEILFPLLQRITRGNFADIHSLLIVKDGKLVLEEYFATNGRRFGPFVKRLFRSRPHHLASTTKAVLSALCGIAIDQGLLKNVDEPIAGILPAYARSFAGKKTAITVEHLLTMTPGWDWEQFRYPWADPRNNAAAMVDSQDVISYVLERPLGAEPGSKFNYSNGAPVVLGEILKNACGRDLDRFAECVLFGPLGIAAHPWTRYSDGTLETDGGLALPSRDLAKIGQLFLDKGEWSGRRLLSEAWIRKSTRPRLSLGGSRDWKYGYYWMQVELKEKDRTINSFFVPGDGGQLLAVFPDMEMVIVLTAGNYGPDPKTVGFLMIGNGILPAVRAQALSRTDASSSRTNFLPRGSS
ncbi:MAG: alpha/beta fold hydrolase, partial [Candidatus Aminicenantes bacterium]|nr:alpha/beta fold hydrolase [Candidatus Aminicenantes bacterium]